MPGERDKKEAGRKEAGSEDQELYRYGYLLLLLQGINLLVAFAIGMVFSCLPELILFLAAYVPLRSYAGGYHADRPVSCGMISAGIELVLALALWVPLSVRLPDLLLPMSVLSEIAIYKMAPVAAKNKPLTDSQKHDFRIKTRWILGAEIFIMLVMWLAGAKRWSLTIEIGHLVTVLLLIAGKYTKKSNTIMQ